MSDITVHEFSLKNDYLLKSMNHYYLYMFLKFHSSYRVYFPVSEFVKDEVSEEFLTNERKYLLFTFKKLNIYCC